MKLSQILIEAVASKTKTLGYHITSKRNLPSIMKKGLLVKKPEDYGTDGDIEGIYFFKTLNDAKNALMNWLGQRIEDIEEQTGKPYDEICLVVDLTDFKNNMIDSVEYEWTVVKNIPSSKIIKTLNV